MGRPKRAADGGLVYHVLNRANARMTIFENDADYAAFEQVLEEAVERTGTRLLAYCLMPNHWHLVLWPREDGELSRFTGWLTLTHTQRWHAHRHSSGSGHLYQGRFKSFPVQDDNHFWTLCRYVERNALRAKLVGGSLAVGQPVPLAVGHGPRAIPALALAAVPAPGVGGARQRPADRGGTGGPPPLRAARPPLRGCGVDAGDCAAPGSAKHSASPRAAEEVTIGSWHLVSS
jgi:REP element-mobilizing transposase RayT